MGGNWQNSTSLQPSASVGGGFCAAHRVGYFCQGFSRVRCCRSTWGYVQCGSVAQYRGCGWHGAVWHYTEAPEAEYLEEPSEADAEHPKPELENWQNSTSLQPSASVGGGFCAAHRVGYFCQGFSRVRCCRSTWGYVQCGSVAQHPRLSTWRSPVRLMHSIPSQSW